MENTIVTLSQLETTWIGQFCKPHNMARLLEFSQSQTKDKEELINYYKWFISVLSNTPAWGVSGVNTKVNELTIGTWATLTNAKKGKISVGAHARKMCRDIEYWHDKPVTSKYVIRVPLTPIIPDDILDQFLSEATV